VEEPQRKLTLQGLHLPSKGKMALYAGLVLGPVFLFLLMMLLR